MIENENNNQNQSNQKPPEQKDKPDKVDSLHKVLLLSVVAGVVGGVLGLFLLSRIPTWQKYIQGTVVQRPIQENVTLTEESAIIDVVKKAGPAVVSIVITKDLSKVPGLGFSPFGFDPFFDFFGRDQNQRNTDQPNVQKVGAGSGFLVSADGLILTNKHVVSDEQANYTVITSDGRQYDAKILAIDPRNDLAIIKIDIKDAPFLTLADSSQIQLGQRVIAIGNSLGEYQNTVTQGIVSGIGRSITAGGQEGTEQLEGVIQTDAAINPGNSGGPLLNTAAEVIGINTAIDRQGQLVGFAIPANDAMQALESYKKYGKIVRPYLGVRYIIITPGLAQKENLPKDYGALLVKGERVTDLAVIPGSPADKANLVENDIILEVDGVRIDENHTLAGLIKNKSVGETVILKVYHKGEIKEVKITLGSL